MVLQQVHSSLRRLTAVTALPLIAMLCVGCAGYTQRAVPSLSVSASAFDFQSVVVGQTATKSFSISNTGAAPLQIAALTVSNKQFSVSGPAVPQTILPANSVSFTLTFAPTATGAVSGNLAISTNTVVRAGLITLAGKGQAGAANLLITPNSVNFGNQTLKSKATQNVTLQNTGDQNLALQGVTVSGSGFGYSDLSPGFSLAPNQRVTFQVWFTPNVVGPAAATLSLLSPNLSSPGTLNLSGDGVTSKTSPTPTPGSQHTVALTWAPSKSQVIGYRVYRSESSGAAYSALNGTAIDSTSYSDSTVTSGNTYYYVVTAVDSEGEESIHSNQATAVIP